jgi:hypothetical protein
MEERKAVMLMRIGSVVLLIVLAVAPANAQMQPVLLKTPSLTDTSLSGMAQGMSSEYSAVLIYVCTSSMQPVSSAECSSTDVAGTGPVRKQALVNLGGAPFVVTAKDGKFVLTMTAALTPGTYLWFAQVTLGSRNKQPTIMTSVVVQVPAPPTPRVPVIQKANLSISGTDSASRDIGATATLDLQHGAVDQGIGRTRLLMNGSYDDKWKSKPLSSNVSHMYAGELGQFRQFRPNSYFGPYATAYHNNTQGMRVEQTYGFGVEKDSSLKGGFVLVVSAVPQVMLENLYAPGQAVNLFGVRLLADLNHSFGRQGKGVIETRLTYTPTLNQTHDWNATGLWSLDIPLSQRWSMNFMVVDNYYEIAPVTFNKNYLRPSVGLKFSNGK